MRKPRFPLAIRLFVCLTALTAYASGFAYAANNNKPDPAIRLTIEQGEIIGTRGRDNARAWYGIPFAEPPVGDLRWRAPRPKTPWTSPLEATDFSSRCFQYTNGVDKGYEEGIPVGSEDCLHINVWAPAKAQDTALPVMFWIHGGGNVWGFSGQYELGRMAERHNLIIVSANYRLGPFGWFANPAIQATAEHRLDQSANFGTLDLVAALDWIQTNIGAFGGNPDNVTIFGESAGGFNVAALLASPLSAGKFHRAVIQSGGFQSVSMEKMRGTTVPDGTKTGLSSGDIIEVLESRELIPAESSDPAIRAKALRSLSADVFFEAVATARPEQPGALSAINTMSTVSDGITIPEAGVLAQLNSGNLHDVPVIIGTNRDETLGLGFFEEGMVKDFLGVVFWARDKEYYQLSGEYPNRFWRAVGVDKPAEMLSKYNKSPVFSYRFDWDEQGRTFLTNISELVGAAHALEIPFVVGGFDDEVGDPLGISFTNSNRKGREELSSAMMSYWAAFAQTGNPGTGMGGSYPLWRPWTSSKSTPNTIIFDTEKDGGVRMEFLHETTETLMASLREDERLNKGFRRCYVAGKSVFLLSRFVDDLSPYRTWADDICGGREDVPAYSE